MIKKETLVKLSSEINLPDFIDNFFEQKIKEEQDAKKQKLLIQIYSEGWGDTLNKWSDKAANFLGQTRKNFSNAIDTFRQTYNKYKPEQSKLQIAEKAYELLKNANLLDDANLKKSLDNVIINLKNTSPTSATESTNFKNWLISEEKKRLNLRPELQNQEIKRFEVNIGDIVEMGPESEFRGKKEFQGKKINRIAQVVEIRPKEIVVKDLTKQGNPKVVIPISELYDKEELRGQRIIPREEAELKALGGKRLWVRLTPRQHKKFSSLYRAQAIPEIIPITKDDRPNDALRRMFSAQSIDRKPEEILPMFSEKPKETPKVSPLGKFLASRRGF